MRWRRPAVPRSRLTASWTLHRPSCCCCCWWWWWWWADDADAEDDDGKRWGHRSEIEMRGNRSSVSATDRLSVIIHGHGGTRYSTQRIRTSVSRSVSDSERRRRRIVLIAARFARRLYLSADWWVGGLTWRCCRDSWACLNAVARQPHRPPWPRMGLLMRTPPSRQITASVVYERRAAHQRRLHGGGRYVEMTFSCFVSSSSLTSQARTPPCSCRPGWVARRPGGVFPPPLTQRCGRAAPHAVVRASVTHSFNACDVTTLCELWIYWTNRRVSVSSSWMTVRRQVRVWHDSLGGTGGCLTNDIFPRHQPHSQRASARSLTRWLGGAVSRDAGIKRCTVLLMTNAARRSTQKLH